MFNVLYYIVSVKARHLLFEMKLILIQMLLIELLYAHAGGPYAHLHVLCAYFGVP